MRKFIKILGYILGSILILLILSIAVLQSPWGQNMVREKVIAYLNQKLNTEISIGKLSYRLPNHFTIIDLFIADRNKDTLLYLHQLKLDWKAQDLFLKKIVVKEISINGLAAQIIRPAKDTNFNFQFIIDAFASNKSDATLQKQSSSSPTFRYDFQKIYLNNIQFRYNDTAGGVLFYAKLGKAFLRPTLVDIDKNKYALNELKVANVFTSFVSDTSFLPPPPPDTAAPIDFQVAADQILLNNIHFTMLSHTDSLFFGVAVGKLQTELKQFELLNEQIKVGTLALEDAKSRLIFGKDKINTSITKNQAESDTSSNNWKIWADGLTLNKIDFQMDDPNTPKYSPGMDYNHLNFQQIFFTASNAFYSSDSIAANLKHLALREQSGLKILDFRTKATYTNQGAILRNLYLQTPNSILQDYLSIHYPSLAQFSNQLNRAQVKIKLQESKIGINDVLLFLPHEGQKQLLPYQNKHLKVVADIQGNLDKIKLKRLYLSGLNNTTIDLNGTFNGLPNLNKLNYDLNIKKLYTSKQDISPFLPDSLEQQFQLPEWLTASGRLRGTTQDYYPDLFINTADGAATLQGKLLLSSGTDKEKYDLSIQTNNLNLGKILKQDSLIGKVSSSIQVQGEGSNPQKMNARIRLNLQSAWLKGYNYQHIDLYTIVNAQTAIFESMAHDSNLAYQLNGTAHLQNKFPALKINLNLQHADLRALKLTEDTLSVAGKFIANFTSLNPDYPVGSFSWEKPFINYQGKNFYPADFTFLSKPDSDNVQHLQVNLANILEATGKGHIPLSKLTEVIKAHINRHYHIADSLEKVNLNNYDFAFDGKLHYQPVLKQFVPELAPFKTILFNSSLNIDSFGIVLNAAKLQYGSNILDSIHLKVEEDNRLLQYKLSLKKAETPAAALWYPYIGGIIRNDSIYAVVNIDDSLKQKQFTIGGAYFHDHHGDNNSLSYFKLFKGLRFNYERWAVNPDNLIVFEPTGFYIKNLDISHDTQSVIIHSEDTVGNAPLNLSIAHFSLANFTRMFSRDTLLADGILTAKAQIDFSKSNQPKINASVFVDHLKVYNYPLGSLSSKIQNKDAQTLSTFLSLDGDGNHFQVYGNYYLEPVDQNDFDLTLLIEPLSLKSIQGLTFGSLKNSSGSINGQLAVKGTLEEPLVSGTIYTDQLATTVATLNASFKMPSDSIRFDARKISFNNFRIEDRKGHPAILNGKIFTHNYRDYFLKLNFNAQRWQALHSQKKDNPAYYGDLIFSANLNLSGMATAPKIDGNIVVHDSTSLHYALSDNGPGMVASDGIVAFVDSRDTTTHATDSTAQQEKKRFRLSPSTQLNVNVDVDKNATFTVLIDPATGDELQVNGEAALNAFMDPSGTIGLTGTYQIRQGYYELNYNFLHRKFEIQNGSSITLAGDPLDAIAAITAVYNTEVAPYDLVEDVSSPDQLIYFKQRLPFQVVLKINGKVMKPEIAFDIVLPDDKTNVVSTNVSNLVQAKLVEIRNNPSELNKQVFAILILNKFLPNNPFSSGDGINVEYAARKSVSRFLSDQLNQVAGHLVKGLELNFDLNSTEDYSTGIKNNQTNLNITASKSLFNDRLKFTVGNDFLLEGESAPRQQSSLIPGNLSVSYLLSKDGKYQANAYRTNQMQDIVNGYVVETGLKFKITLTYNKFKYLFVNKKKYFARLRAKRAQETAGKDKKLQDSNKENEIKN